LLVGPALIALHLARRRPAAHGVPFLRIWERALPRRRSGARRLEDLLSLAAALAVLGLLAAAAARPCRPPPLPEDVLIVLDDTAGMGARDADGETRLRKAAGAAAAAMAASPPHVRFALARVAGWPRLDLPFDAGRERVAAALAAAQARPAGGRAAAAVRSLSPLVDGRPGARVWVASDAQEERLPPCTPGGTPIESVAAGDRSDNVRVAAFSAHWGRWWETAATLFARVENAGTGPAAFRLEVRAGEESAFERDLELGPGEAFETVVPVARREKAWAAFGARVSPGGALALDDRAWCAVPPAERKRVLLVSARPSPFLRAALQGLEGLADRERSGDVDPGSWRRALGADDLAVLEGVGPGEAFPAGGCLVIGPPPGALPGAPAGPEERQAAVTDWDREHPVTRGLSFDNAFFRTFLPLPREYRPLVSTERGTVVGAREGPGGRAVVLSAPLSETNLGLLLAFPILVRNALAWAGERDGGAIAVPAPPAPDGPPPRWIEGAEGGPGLASADGRLLAVNFADEEESRVRAAEPGRSREFAVPPPRDPPSDPWPAFVWAALAVLALEGGFRVWRRRAADRAEPGGA
ncbi:MAG: VWA domain-containing protein, partial [Planctomycetes bacterium]|nr:VWA domain-containing protein [Planctomycetota bacterium]